MTENKGERLQFLFHQYLSDQISEGEYGELWDLLHLEATKNPLSEELQWLWEKVKDHQPVISAKTWDEKITQLINEENGKIEADKEKRPLFRMRFTGWAAAIILALILGIIYFSHKQTVSIKVPKTAQNHDLLPGGNRATLTLSNGSVISLDSATKQIISQQGNAKISSANGKIKYSSANSNTGEVVYNTLSTPRGGQYQITLPDGTKAWLNAASSLHFPTAFKGTTREVQMTGEVYFEVAANAAKPFEVSVDGMKIKVLGTHFNVNAYDNESVIRTTLLSGSVSVKEGNVAALLSPGEQAQVNKEGNLKVLKEVDLDETIAWKNNLFWFQDNTIQEVMRQISRWYNADVVIEGTIPQHFTGSIPRDVNVSKVFEVLQETGRIHFTITDNKITVSP